MKNFEYQKLKSEHKEFDKKYVINVPISDIVVSSDSQQRATGNRTERVEAFKTSLQNTKYELKTPISVRLPRTEGGKIVYDLTDGWARLQAEKQNGETTIKATTWLDKSSQAPVEEDEVFQYQVNNNNHLPSYSNTAVDIAGNISKSLEKGWIEKWIGEKRPDPTKDEDNVLSEEWLKKAAKDLKQRLFKEHKVVTQTIEKQIRKSLSKGKSEYYEAYRSKEVIQNASEDPSFEWEGSKAGSVHTTSNKKKTVVYVAKDRTHFNNTIKGWCTNQKQQDPEVVVKVIGAIEDTSTITDEKMKTTRDDLRKSIQDANKYIEVRGKSPVDEFYVIGQIKTGDNKEDVGSITRVVL